VARTPLDVAVLGLFTATLGVLLHGRRRDAARLASQRELARVDELTGLPNRRAGREGLGREHERLERTGSRAGLLLIDVDRFKQVNDVHGYRCGDGVLRAVARSIADEVRKMDLVCRWGGEEFVVIAPDASGQTSCALAERIRAAIGGDLGITVGSVPLSVTVSIGVAELRAGEDPLDCLERANGALRQAKRTRDAVACAVPTSTAPATRQGTAASSSP
jgi:diguanylate cyclase